MDLALLELTETVNGDVLEQLLVITRDEVAEPQPRALTGTVNRVRLFARIDSGLPGVPSNIREQLERAALSILAGFAMRYRGEVHPTTVGLRALWREGHLQELSGLSLNDSVARWAQQPGSADDYVLFELTRLSPSRMTNVERGAEHSYALLRDNVTKHIHRCWAERRLIAAAASTAENLESSREILFEAAAQRESLVAQWLTRDQVSAKLGAQHGGGEAQIGRLRREGQLLAAYVTHPVAGYCYPTWQFRADGQPVSHLAEILSALRDLGPFQRESDGLRRTTGWGEVEWFLSPHALLDGATPAAVLGIDPARVLRAAKIEFENDP